MDEILNNREYLLKLAHTQMPFGKYKNRYLIDIPEAYFLWFKQKGFPKNELGEMMQLMLEIKTNGLEQLIRDIQKL